MSYTSVDPHWGSAALDEDSLMDAASDPAGPGHNGLLHPIPRTLVDDALSMKSFEDEDMLDLSPQPSPRPQPVDEPQAPTSAPLYDGGEASQPITPAQAQADNPDEITFDEEEEEDNDATPTGDTHDTSPDDPAIDQVPPAADDPAPLNGAEDSEYPELIDYSDLEEDEAEYIPGSDKASDDSSVPRQPRLVDETAGETHSNREGTVEPDDDAAAREPSVSGEKVDEFPSGNDAGPGESADYTELAHNTEDHPKYSSHPVVVDFYNQWIALFKGSLPEFDSTFNVEEDVLYGNISLVLEHMRKSHFVEASEWEHLEIHVPSLDLWIREKSVEADQYSFADILNTYLDLHSHDGNYEPDPLFLTLTVRPVFSHQLERLQAVAGLGEGFSKCEFLKSTQPSFNPSDGGSYGDEFHPDHTGEDHLQEGNNESHHDDHANRAISVPNSGASASVPQEQSLELLPENENHSETNGVEDQAEAKDAYDETDSYDYKEHDGSETIGPLGTTQDSEVGDKTEGEISEEQYEGYGEEDEQHEYNLAAPEENGQQSYEGDGTEYFEAYDHEYVEQSRQEIEGAHAGDDENYAEPTNPQDYEQTNHEHGIAYDDGEIVGHDNGGAVEGEDFEGDVDHSEEYLELSGVDVNHDESVAEGELYHSNADGEDDPEADGELGDLYNETEDQDGIVDAEAHEAVEHVLDIDGYGEAVQPPEEAFIGYFDGEGGRDSHPVGTERPELQEQPAAPEDEITYSDDEEGVVAKTPTKRPREEDDLGSDPKRIKS